VKESSPGPSSLLQEFTAQQHANVFLKAFSFPTTQLPRSPDDEAELADRVVLMDDIGFIYHLKEREQKVATKPGDLEKWVANNVVKKGAKQVQNTRDLLASYAGLSLVNHFGHRVFLGRRDPNELVSMII
jgi:hypothetical protein